MRQQGPQNKENQYGLLHNDLRLRRINPSNKAPYIIMQWLFAHLVAYTSKAKVKVQKTPIQM